MYRAIAEFGYPNFAAFTFTLYFCRSAYCEMRGDSQVHLTIADTCCPLFWINCGLLRVIPYLCFKGNKIKAVPLNFA